MRIRDGRSASFSNSKGKMNRTIDVTKCIGCGLCVDDCVNHYLLLDANASGKRVATFQKYGRCLNCGHCNAICPNTAITGGDLVEKIEDYDNLLALIATKRSVRKYVKNSIISQDVLNKIILAAQSAPTDRNRKSARIVLVKEELPVLYNQALDWLVEEVKKTGTINPLYVPTMRLNANRNEILWNAEYLVVFIGSEKNIIDSAISAERMQLEACNLGIGTAYRGDMKNAINNVSSLQEMLEIKKNEIALVAFAMGITEIKYLRPAIKLNRKVVYK